MIAAIGAQLAFFLIVGAASTDLRRAGDSGLFDLGMVGFGIIQALAVYRLSTTLGEAAPWRRAMSLYVPFAALGVAWAIHSKAIRQLRRSPPTPRRMRGRRI